MKLLLLLLGLTLYSSLNLIQLPGVRQRNREAITGSGFYKQAVAMNWQQRDSFAFVQIIAGNMPSFLKQLHPVRLSAFDSSSLQTLEAIIYVTPDYLSVGSDADWARIPLTPMTAQQLADSFQCFLPTQKIVDAVYSAATVKPEPVWLFAFRDSTPVMYHHHLMIEGLRKQRKGLIAGIKKDIIITDRLLNTAKPNRVAIYGWHKINGEPIQQVYTGHVNWYADYSHGIRLVYRKIRMGKKWVDYETVLKDSILRKLLTYESSALFTRYPYQK